MGVAVLLGGPPPRPPVPRRPATGLVATLEAAPATGGWQFTLVVRNVGGEPVAVTWLVSPPLDATVWQGQRLIWQYSRVHHWVARESQRVLGAGQVWAWPVAWRDTDLGGRHVGSGTYLVRMTFIARWAGHEAPQVVGPVPISVGGP